MFQSFCCFLAPSPVKSRHAHLYVPIVASQFPANYPFLEQRLAAQNAGTLQIGATGRVQNTPFITETGHFHIPPAPAAPVALVPVIFLFYFIQVLGSPYLNTFPQDFYLFKKLPIK